MKVLRALYLAACLVISAPIIIGWVLFVFGWSLINAIRYEETLSDNLKVGIVEPFKFGVWLYGNIIKHGNKYSQFSYDEFTI